MVVTSLRVTMSVMGNRQALGLELGTVAKTLILALHCLQCPIGVYTLLHS